MQQGGCVGRRPHQIGSGLNGESEPSLGGYGRDPLDQEREGLLGCGDCSAVEKTAQHRRIEPGASRRKAHVIVPALAQRYHRVGGLDRRPLAFEELCECLCDRGAQEAVGAAVVMVECGRGDVRDRTDAARRELCLAFFLKNLQGRSEQGSACIHGTNIAPIYRVSIALLYCRR